MKIMLSDLHLAPFRNEKFLTQEKNFIEAIIFFFANFFSTKEQKMIEKMRKTVMQQNIKLGIFNGDFAESSRTERGMNTERDLKIIAALLQEVLCKLGLENCENNLGNHESGYDLPLCSDKEKGINWKAIQNFLVFAGWKDLYHSFYADGCKIIFIPYIFSEETAKDFDLREEKKKFLAKMKQDLTENIPTILLVHDPDSFDDPGLLQLIRTNRGRIKFIFYGHYHSWINLLFMRILSAIYTKQCLGVCRWILDKIFSMLTKGDTHIVVALGEYFRKRRNIPGLIKELDAILIPAPGGTLGIGGGYLTLNIETGEVKKYK